MDEAYFFQVPEEANLSLADPSLLDYYYDRNARTFWLLGEIDDSWNTFSQQIIRINREDVGIPVDERKPIKFIIASGGGSAEITDDLVNLISISKTPIYGYGLGMIASGASMIFLACHKKYALKNAYFIIHKGGVDNVGGDYIQLAAFMKNYDRDVEKVVNFYKTHTSFEGKYIEDKMNGADWYVYLDEAIEHGMVDEVIEDIEVML